MKFGEIETIRLLGKGGMSEVWEAENPRLGSRHAVKVYAYPREDAEVRARFEQEGRMLARMSHPRIVRVTDVGAMEDGRPYFVMDLVLNPEGKVQTLADVPDGSVDETVIGRWYDDIREGLAYIHGNGIVHRDLKLQNVMIGPDGHAVLTDFGIAHVGAKADGATIIDPVNTIIGIRDGKKPVMGSLGYMAPELEMGCEVSPQSDWYALGVLVFRMLSGTWCDARTDLATTLETYDSVWMRIVPRLLHANPNGRECRSYAVEKCAEAEKAAMESESRWLKEKGRGHLARHVARYVAVCALLVTGSIAAMAVWYGERLADAERRLAIPGFADVFKVPAEAGYEDADGMPSVSRFHLALVDVWMLTRGTFEKLRDGKISLDDAQREIKGIRWRALNDELRLFDGFNHTLTDAWVLTNGMFEDLKSGKITPDKALDTLEELRKRVQSGEMKLFDGFSEYNRIGENDVLVLLLDRAITEIEKYRNRAL